MTAEEVRVLAERTLLPVLGEEKVDRIEVREQDDWTGDPALYIDVVVDPDLDAPDAGRWLSARRSLSDRLVELGDMRFPFVSLTDRKERVLSEVERQAFE